MIRLVPALFFCILSVRAGAQAYTQSVTNYGSGISLTFSGTPGEDWAEEYFWHNRIEDDHKVVYIKSSTVITMSHNENNIRGGQDRNDAIYIGADGGGQIRYRVDRDLQWKYHWADRGDVSGTDELYPAYTAPFSFGDLEYSPGLPVVGTIGGQGSDMTDRVNSFYAGCLDGFGDEWHTIAFADDDTWAGIPDEHSASDGKIILFVVDPKTPCVYFSRTASNARFYTTPPKAYWIPRVHAQTTYLTGDVNISLVNIMDGDIYYRFGDNAYRVYTGPISSNDLTDGEHVLEYYYNDSYHKTRTIIKNPSYPSDDDAITGQSYSHGRIFLKHDSEIQAVRNRVVREPYAQLYGMIVTKPERNDRDQPLGQGKRVGGDHALTNALLGLIEGFDHVLSGDSISVGAFCKKLLLDNKRKIDPLGWGDLAGSAFASRELNYRGYYDVNVVFSLAAAYDIMIRHYKSTEVIGGITPIEDHKIRDMLARFVLECMMDLGGYGFYTGVAQGGLKNASGMWGTAREMGAIVCALAMPSYNTRYYGTAGLDGTAATHPNTPFPDYPVSWQEAFFTETNQLYSYPNQSHRFETEYTYSADPPHGRLLIESPVVRDYDGRTLPEGSWRCRIRYYSRALMGHCYWIAANAMQTVLGSYPSRWTKTFELANNGLLYGTNFSSTGDEDPRYVAQPLLVNERFPDLAGAIQRNMVDRDQVWDEFSRNGTFGILLYRDDWEDHVAVSDGPVRRYAEDGIPYHLHGLPNPITAAEMQRLREREEMRVFSIRGVPGPEPASGIRFYIRDGADGRSITGQCILLR